MLETLLHSTVQPATTIEQIRTWITAAPVVPTPFSMPSLPRDVVVKKGSNSFAIRETITELGPHQMFGIVAEPVGDTHGPLIAMINGVNEDHVGPARLWVELSRRWASMGLRCVRFDLSELGESPWLPGQPDRPIFDKTRSQDVSDAVRELLPEHSSEAVLIGYCSGAILAFEVALELKTRGVCAINPQVGSGVFLNVDRLDQTEGKSIRSVARRVEGLLENHQRIKKVIRPIARVVLTSKVSEKLVFNTLKLSSPCPPKVRSALVRNHTEILLLVSPEDLSSFRRIPIIGSFLRRRLASSDHFDVEIVPGLDHAFLSTVGRGRAVALLDQHIVEAFGP
jgi:alpha/beta superfamily hydrolase